MNFSLRQMLFFFGLAAVALGSMAVASPVIGDVFYTLGLLTIAFAMIAAIYTYGTRRAFWVGFVICFAGYFGHTVWPSELRNTWLSLRRMGQLDSPAPDVVTTRGLSLVYPGVHDPSQFMQRPPGFRTNSPNSAATGQYLAFMTIGHTLFAFALGFGGGMVAQRFASEPLALLKRSIENPGA
jgi:hypothetical protein